MVRMANRVFSEIDLGELRVLDTLLREGSITRAAQALETSQPAVSRILRRLRERLVMRVRRNSISSSGETTISVCISTS